MCGVHMRKKVGRARGRMYVGAPVHLACGIVVDAISFSTQLIQQNMRKKIEKDAGNPVCVWASNHAEIIITCA